MSHHRATVYTPVDYDAPRRLVWRNHRRRTKPVVVKCVVCFPTGKTNKRTKHFRDRKYRDPRQDYRDARYELYTDLVEDREWKLDMEHLFGKEDDLYWDDFDAHYYDSWLVEYCKRHPGQEAGDCSLCDLEERDDDEFYRKMLENM